MTARRGADDAALPVAATLPALLDALEKPAASAVLVAEPGAGKTTLVPNAILDAPWCTGRVILVEPRRIAARSAAQRIAALRGELIGRTVGWRMRGDTRIGSDTRLEVVTDGVLTRLLQDDPSLAGIDAVVFDEFHERSLDTDVGLALCLDVREALRPDLRLVAMSATIDAVSVAGLLDTKTIFDVPGRSYPVDTVWIDDAPASFDARAVARVVRRALHESPRDVLVFLPGAGEIRAVQRALDGIERDGIDVLPLFGALSPAAQDQALAPARAGRRKVVLSTSIAETSLTIDGVDAIVDSGWSRRARFDVRRGMGGLVTTRVSRASADQRRGRAGRTAHGRAYRMWSAADHQRLAAHDEAEITIADLTGLALELVRWGDRDAAGLRFLDPPPTARLGAARKLLRDLGLLDAHDRLTDHGRRAAELPLHPRLAHALVRAAELGKGWEACVVAAVLSEDQRESSGTVDLQPRVSHIDDRTKPQSRRLARQLALTAATGPATDAAAGLVVALAYPDRIARRRGIGSRYLLSSGAGAFVDEKDPLARCEWIAVADLDLRQDGDARILRAAMLDPDELSLVSRGAITTERLVEWDRQLGDVRAEERTCLGAIVVSSRRLEAATDTTDALLDGVRSEGLGLLPQWSSTQAYRSRIGFCREVLGTDWPDLSEASLLEGIDNWLRPWLATATKRSELDRVDVRAALRALVDPTLQRRLDELAPREITLPSGRIRPLTYDHDTAILRLRVQDAFGWTESPRIAGGRRAVVLHLLSPADRPVQVTSDLAGFWHGSYAQVRSEMRGRYPKHAWPEDPTAPA